MDLLGSILGNMDAPPMTASDKEALKKAKGKKGAGCQPRTVTTVLIDIGKACIANCSNGITSETFLLVLKFG